jgi:hypothetical protein
MIHKSRDAPDIMPTKYSTGIYPVFVYGQIPVQDLTCVISGRDTVLKMVNSLEECIFGLGQF